jgi:hypothetical protein
VLGYDTENPDPQWAVTCKPTPLDRDFACNVADRSNADFSKTLFTPAGMDIYLRKPLTHDADRTRLETIVDDIRAMPGEPGQLGQQGFIVGEA